ncbi:MAG: hypothetical protein NC205_07160, partial [Prevotella sp.]|nr:hypothetical protein [Prevotella sp.]
AVIVSYHGRNYIIDFSGYKNPEYVNKYLADNNIKNIYYLILHKNIHSLYVAYMNELENINQKNILAYGNITPCGNDKVILFDDDGYRIDTEDYSIIYENEILRIIYKNSETDFISTKSAVPENRGLTIFYGNITKNTDIQYDEKSIYLDKRENLRYSGMNNFKMEVSTDGNFRISELK